MDTSVEQALAVAQSLVAGGIPVFAAPPAPGTKVGFRLPSHWEQTRPDPALVAAWQPGWALCLVCGHGLDGIDVDTYAGGDLAVLEGALGGTGLPLVYGRAATPSGGTHLLIRSLGVASKNALLPGIDIKAGDAAGSGRGFLFIAPTVRVSKVTQLPGTYSWLPGGVDLRRLRDQAGLGDPGLEALAALVTEKRRGLRGPGQEVSGSSVTSVSPGSPSVDTLDSVSPEAFMSQPARGKGPWADVAATLRANGRNDGVMRLAAALRETTAYSLDEALGYMYEHVWPLIDQRQGGHGFPASEFEEVVAAVWRQYPGAGDRIAGAAARGEGIEEAVRQAAAGESAGNIPLPHSTEDLTDARLVQWTTWTLSGADGQWPYKWAPGLGWMRWRGWRWQPADAADVNEQVRRYFLDILERIVHQQQGGVDQAFLAKLVGLQSRAKITAAVDLSRGHETIRCDAGDFDAHPDLLNTPAGVVNLRTGELGAHDPKLMLTKITSGNYRPGFTHPDWEQALTALDAPEREWYQGRVGQGVTGHPPEDGIMPVLQGPGSNGKTLLSTDGLLPALGDYSSAASHKLITSQKAGSSEHSTEMADLQGKRLLIGEELSEGRSIDVTALKRIMDVSQIRARFVHKDNISFTASHSLFCTTNYRPVINETDHGTWRRLALLVFRYTFRKPEEELVRETDRHGDPDLKIRIRRGWEGQHDAVVTWAVQGAMRWYGRGMTALPPTERITADTRAWRASADHIMSFWDEFLVKDAGEPGGHPPCISGSHLHAVFNAWLAKNGHTAWTKQTFAARFGEHGETTSKAVRYELTRRLANLSWYRGGDLQVPAETIAQQMRVWVGARFRLPAENAPTWGCDVRDGSLGNFSSSPHMEELPEDPSRTSHPPATRENAPGPAASDTLVTQAPPDWNVQVTPPPPEPPRSAAGTLVFDLETADASSLFTYTESDETGFVRLAGALGPDGVPRVMSAPELLPLLEQAETITGHNVLGFDLLALAHHHGADYTRLAAKAVDTELIARQADPPRSRETHSGDSYDLTSVAERLGVPGKTDDAARIARKHGGWDKIPLDDPEYRSYLEGDLRSTAAVAAAMAERYGRDPYLDREHKLAAIAGQMTLNGFLVDQELLAGRLAAGQAKKREALQFLHDVWGLPLTRTVMRGRGENKTETEQEIASPLATDAGRAWLESMWERYQIPDPPRTGKTGKLSTGADDLAAVARDPRCPADVKSMIALIGIIVGTRTVYQTAQDCLSADGRVHPGNSFRQASGRWSVTNPGLTVFGKRGGRHHERDIFLPDPGHVLLSFDLSQVDMRSMAGHSQDPNYMSLFAPGRDAHQEIADQVGLDRQSAKAIGHGWNYGLGAKRMIENGLDAGKVSAFIAGMEARFPTLIAWREQIREMGKSGEILDNGFGRRMRCDPSRAYTVAPALMGQGGARDIMCQCLLRLPRELDQYLRVMVHDEILLSIPADMVRDVIPVVKAAMTWEWRGVPITCDMSLGASWGECSAH